LLKRQAVASIVMRRQVTRFSVGVINGQFWTSSKVRPQPLQTSSPWLVEQIAMHGASRSHLGAGGDAVRRGRSFAPPVDGRFDVGDVDGGHVVKVRALSIARPSCEV
jgi:hypothetical protein